jgi:rhodanese-related sulfurtransferase
MRLLRTFRVKGSEASLSELHIDVEELHFALDAGEDIQLLDVRDEWEYALARLDAALLVPMRELEKRIAELDPNRPTVVYCHHGIRSLHAALALRSRGFANVRSLRGGIDRWSVAVDPSVPRY